MLSTNYYNPINHHNLINDNQNTNTNHNISIGNSTSSHIINNTCKKRNNNTYNRINKKSKDFTKKKIITSNTNTNSTTTANNVYPVDASANQGSNNTSNKIFRKMACTSCKRRKIKCDGAKPVCGSCSKRKLAQEYCIYDSSPWISGAVREKKMLDQIAELRREKNELLNKIRLLEKNDDTTVDNPANTSSPVQQISPYFVDEFYTLFKENSGDGSDSCVYYGPFSWQTLVKFDDSFNFVSDKIIKKIREDCYVDLKSTHDNSRSLRYTNLYSNEASIMTDNIRQDVLPKGVDYPLYRSLNSMDHKVELLQVYLEFLPNILELKILIDNYFEGFASYAFFCVLDKEDLYADFEDIFGIDLNTITSVSHHPPLKLDCKMINKNIANVFSRFARLILTSALSFFLGLGNFINMSEAKNINGIREIKLLERFPYVNDPKQIYDIFTKYDISYVEDLTELCLNLDGFLGTPSIPILHTLCMFFIYTLLNTRHLMDFELYTMHSLFTLATRMAIKLGLHSDIDVLYKDYPLKFRKQLKKTWIFLLFHDYYQNIRTGTPLNIVWKQELYYHTLLKRAREDLSTCYCVVLFFQQFLSRFSNADAAECIHLITEMSHLCRDHFKLDLSDIFELISSGTLHEKELYANIRLIRTYLYVYALASSVFQNMYVSTNSQPLLKEKYRLWALKYSTIYLMSVLDILKTLKQFHVKYNLDKNCIFYLLRHIRDLAIKPILFLSGLIIEYLKEYRLKSNDLAYKTKQTKMFRIDDLIEGQTVLNTSLRELEIPFDENNTDELHKLGKIFAKNNTMTLLRFLYMVLEELNDFLSDIKIYDIRYIFLYLNILITYVVENFKDLKFDVSFVNKDFLMTFNSNKKQSDIRKNKKEFEKRDFSSNNNSGAGSSKIDLKGKIPSFKSKNGLKQVHNIESNALREENIYRIETNKHDNSIKTTSNANSFIDSNVINNNNNNNIKDRKSTRLNSSH
ncbi:uncharacterized protein SCODWIG_03731 [Saccharomycodes ludwigii]|uniref:Zn(2)-C6 fungal-type domain-containing protein n=1 Tax=Saccharomycodes ludwigii TaxID=36035 RepID=A0A376BCW6_9ASCO|nr:uncharacterized protein SCODWIG_03731 [Saccharomycodes ludwigii]